MSTSILDNVLQETSSIKPLNMAAMLAFFFLLSASSKYILYRKEL